MNKKIFSLSIILIFSFLSCQDNSFNKNNYSLIDANNTNIHYGGRFDRSNPKIALFDWPGVHIKAKFEGKQCAIRLEDENNFYNIYIDDKKPYILKTDTSSTYVIAENLKDTIHTVLIEKRTEATIGKGKFKGFILDKGRKLLPIANIPTRKIEYIGNSITCGYGAEGETAESPFTPETENAGLTYAALIGKHFNADYSLIAYSGKGVVRNYGDSNKTSKEPMPSLYNRICYYDSSISWDFSSWIPDVVVINLGTNDFSTQPYPDKDIFQEAYKKLINRVQNLYSEVTVFCICGPMIGEPCCEYIDEVVKDFKDKEKNKVYFIKIDHDQLSNSDWGSNWHPNVTGHKKIANIAIPVIKEKMSW